MTTSASTAPLLPRDAALSAAGPAATRALLMVCIATALGLGFLATGAEASSRAAAFAGADLGG